jgi:hypothetical protein
MILRVAGEAVDHLIAFPLGGTPYSMCGKHVMVRPLRGFKPMCKTCLRVVAAKPEVLCDNQQTSTDTSWAVHA